MDAQRSPTRLWPAAPPSAISPTVDYLHRLAQIAGKYTLDQIYEPNWGNIVLDVTGRGYATPTLRHEGGIVFRVDFDLIDGRVTIAANTGNASLPLADGTVAEFFEDLRVEHLLPCARVNLRGLREDAVKVEQACRDVTGNHQNTRSRLGSRALISRRSSGMRAHATIVRRTYIRLRAQRVPDDRRSVDKALVRDDPCHWSSTKVPRSVSTKSHTSAGTSASAPTPSTASMAMSVGRAPAASAIFSVSSSMYGYWPAAQPQSTATTASAAA